MPPMHYPTHCIVHLGAHNGGERGRWFGSRQSFFFADGCGRPPTLVRDSGATTHDAAAFTLPGIIAHKSALRGGEQMKISDFG